MSISNPSLLGTGIDCFVGHADFPMLVSFAPGSLSNPVAITVIIISSSRLLSITAPKIMLASGSTLLCTNYAAVFTSCNPKSSPPVMFIITPFAPSIDVSSNGL